MVFLTQGVFVWRTPRDSLLLLFLMNFQTYGGILA